MDFVNWKTKYKNERSESIRIVAEVGVRFAKRGVRRSQNYVDGYMAAVRDCLEELREEKYENGRKNDMESRGIFG